MISKKNAETLKSLINDYAECHATAEWQRDQGYGSAVTRAERAETEAHTRLLDFIKTLTR